MNLGPRYDLLIKGGLVLTLVEGAAPIPEGFVAVKDGRIEALGWTADLPPEAEAARTMDASGGLVMPGLINGHVHGAMTLFRGLADDLPLETWLNQYIFPAEAAHVDGDLVYWGARLAAAEMLLGGTTGLADGYFLEDHSARAFQEAGLRAVVGQGVIDFPAPGVPDPRENIAVAQRFLERWRGASPHISPSVFCHAPYTCSAETLVKGKELAREYGALFQIHAAETAFEVRQSRERHGLGPIEYLDLLELLDESTLVVHGVHLSEKEIEILAGRRTPVCVCVESNMKLASGLAPVPALLAKGVRLALGTDGPASNNDLNLLGEARSLALVYKAAGLDPTVLPAARVLHLAAPGGAEALGWSGLAGVIAPGRRADLVVRDLGRPNLKPLYNPYSHLVYAADGREVRTVLVDGRVVVEEGRIVSMDLEETKARVREIAARIKG
ncbi:MAG: amidohydrolase [Thermodesulfobacteriota bacterium]